MKKALMGIAVVGMATTWALQAQTQTPSAPAGARTPLPAATGQAPGSAARPATPGAPGAQTQSPPAAPSDPIRFPAVDPQRFTATSPTRETVNAFLHAVWGVDENRDWRVAAIEPATVPGFVKVEVYVADRRQPTRIAFYSFLITPDGKHAVQGDLAPFGNHPFADVRATLQQRADGPARGAANKDLEIVEFSDLQCPNCKAAQSTMDQIVKDFPQAHVVFQNLPLPSVHPFAMQAAEVGNCVRQAKGDPAFFTYAQKVYDTQADLTTDKADATLKAAVTAAGADPAATMTCASSPATKAAVDASIKLAADLGISSTPTLVINGRVLSLTQVPYAALQRVIVFQGQLDGITVKEQPSLTTLK